MLDYAPLSALALHYIVYILNKPILCKILHHLKLLSSEFADNLRESFYDEDCWDVLCRYVDVSCHRHDCSWSCRGQPGMFFNTLVQKLGKSGLDSFVFPVRQPKHSPKKN